MERIRVLDPTAPSPVLDADPGPPAGPLSGKTVEVVNTDAEGRLVLADLLHYAKRFKPDCVVDLATLTGACVVALGSDAIGLFSKNDRVAQRLAEAGDASHERVWRLPMWDDYARLNPRAKAVHDLLTARGERVVNDHIAFRTFDLSPVGLPAIAAPA